MGFSENGNDRAASDIASTVVGAARSSQTQIAESLGISQPAVSQQLLHAPDLAEVHPELVVEAAGPVLRALAVEHGCERLAVFGSVARGDARPNSDIDLVSYGGLKSIDVDIRRDTVLL